VNDQASLVPPPALLEVLYFAGGIRSKFYGAVTRPDWVPPPEQVGLQNDVYLAPGQFAIDISRFRYADEVAREGAAHWFGVYGYAKDLYGDRGNFCGVGLWVPGVSLPDTENLYDMLLKLVSTLQNGGLTENGLSAEFDGLANRALSFSLSPANWLGIAESCVIDAQSSTYGARPVYVVLEDVPVPGARLPADLILAVDALFVSSTENVPGRVLFLPSGQVNIDARISADRIIHGVQGLLKESPRTRLIRSLLDAASTLNLDLKSSQFAREHAEVIAAQLQIEANAANAEIERLSAAPAIAQPALSALPPISSEEFFDRLAGELRSQLRDVASTLPSSREQPGLRLESDTSKFANDLAGLKRDVRLLLESGQSGRSNVPQSWTDSTLETITQPFPWKMWIGGGVGFLLIVSGIWYFVSI
jgi:hypothetical protein